MASGTNPLRPSAEDKRQLLTHHLLTTLEPMLSADTRYADLSVEQIIRAGGIARSTFYDYFDDKSALLIAMADDVLAELFESGRSWWELPDAAGRDELRAALLSSIDTHLRHATIFRAVTEGAAYDPGIRERRARLLNEVTGSLKRYIVKGQRKATIAPDLDAEATAKWLIVMVDGGMYAFFENSGPKQRAALLEALTDVMWRTLYAGYREP